jgi:methylated-DNA-[protein]-cysteine S-methyltransferase
MNKKEVFTDSKIAYTSQYDSPLGTITVACDDEAIIGLWFNGQRHFGNILPSETVELGKNGLRTSTVGCKANALLEDARRWLDVYFSGNEPDFLPPLRYDSTPFRKAVCDIMLTIPYGKTMTYGDIADLIAGERGIEKMSAQAVGGAVGHNPISLMIPCHRVVGTNGSLTGYGGGINRKVKLLELENVDMTALFIPKKGTAL